MHDAQTYEQAVLGAILLTGSNGHRVVKRLLGEGLRSDHFSREKNRAVFRAMVSLTDQDEPVDTLTVLSELQRKGQVKDTQAAWAYVHMLPNAIPAAANVLSYGRIVMELAAWNRKRTYALAVARAAEKQDPEGLAEAEKRLTSIELPGAKANPVRRLRPVEGLA